MNAPIWSKAILAQNYGKLLKARKKNFNETPSMQRSFYDICVCVTFPMPNFQKIWDKWIGLNNLNKWMLIKFCVGEKNVSCWETSPTWQNWKKKNHVFESQWNCYKIWKRVATLSKGFSPKKIVEISNKWLVLTSYRGIQILSTSHYYLSSN